MQTICVAGIYINITSADKEYFHRRYSDYVTDYTDSPDMTMETKYLEVVEEPVGEEVEKIKASHIVRLSDGTLCRYIKSVKTGKIPFAIYFTEDYTKIRIELEKDFVFQGLNNREWEIYTPALCLPTV